jgi:hypothetical protein
MASPRIPRGEPEMWASGPPHYGPMEYWRPVQTFLAELKCPTCRRGRLVANGETHEKGNMHLCDNSSCSTRYIIRGEPYPRRIERVDTEAPPLKGTNYAEG